MAATIITADSKKQAIREAKKLRSEGREVKIFERSGIYTQPGVGIVGYVSYEVHEDLF